MPVPAMGRVQPWLSITPKRLRGCAGPEPSPITVERGSMNLIPGADVAKALRSMKGDDHTLTLQPGQYRGFALYDLRRDFRIIGPGAVFSGGRGLKFENCGIVSLEGLECVNNDSFGVMVVNCAGANLKGLTCSRNQKNGILTANTSNLTVERCICDGNSDQHGIYLSQSGDKLSVIDNMCRGNGRAGIQVNAVQPGRKPKDPKRDSISVGVVIRGNTLHGNQLLGGAGINLAGCREVAIVGNQITGHLGRHGIALWDDGTGKAELACQDCHLNGNLFGFDPGAKPAACISISRNCSNVGVSKNNVFAEGVPMVEGPFQWS